MQLLAGLLFAAMLVRLLYSFFKLSAIWTGHMNDGYATSSKQKSLGTWNDLSVRGFPWFAVVVEATEQGAIFSLASEKLFAKAFRPLFFPWQVVRLQRSSNFYGAPYFLTVNSEPRVELSVGSKRTAEDLNEKVATFAPWLLEEGTK